MASTHRIDLEINQTTSGNAVAKIATDFDKMARAVEKQGKATENSNRHVQKITEGMKEAKKKTDRLSTSSVALGTIMSRVLQDAAQTTWEFVKDSKDAWANYEVDTRRALSITSDASQDSFDGMSDDIKRFAIETNRLTKDVAPAIYTAFSLGVDEDNVFNVLSVASKAAQADADSTTKGLGDLNSTLETGLQILNAYQLNESELPRIYDTLFKGIELGALTMDDFNTGMSAVTSVAAETGVGLDDVTAAMVAMTIQGDSVGEAVELLSLLLTQLGTGGTQISLAFKEITGMSFRHFIQEGGTLIDAMGLIGEYADDMNVSLTDLLGGGSNFFRDSQATRGAMELVNFVGLAGDALTEIQSAEGTMDDIFTISEENVVQDYNALATSLDIMKLAFGEMIAQSPQVAWVIGVLTDFFNAMGMINSNVNEVDKMGDDLIRYAGSADAAEAALTKLVTARKGFDETDLTAGLLTGGAADVLEEDTETLIEILAYRSTSFQDFVTRLQNAGLRPVIEDLQKIYDTDLNQPVEQWTDDLAEGTVKFGDTYANLGDIFRDQQALFISNKEAALANNDALADGADGMLELNLIYGEQINATTGLVEGTSDLSAAGQQQLTLVEGMTAAYEEQMALAYLERLEEEQKVREYHISLLTTSIDLVKNQVEAEEAYQQLLTVRPDVEDEEAYATWVENVETAKGDIVTAIGEITAAYQEMTKQAILSMVATGDIPLEYATEFLTASGIVADQVMVEALNMAATMNTLQETIALAGEDVDPEHLAEMWLLISSGLAATTTEAHLLALQYDLETVTRLADFAQKGGEINAELLAMSGRISDLPPMTEITIITNYEDRYSTHGEGDTPRAHGGYTGNKPIYAKAGIVHGQEYVIRASAVKQIGISNLDKLNRGEMPTQLANRTSSSGSITVQVNDVVNYYSATPSTAKAIEASRASVKLSKLTKAIKR
jgi:TP901 family phage tail tape measure protein